MKLIILLLLSELSL
jgi:hypothetical protein